MALHIVLIEPEIPQNTGTIARTCAATGTVLHLVKPLGFSISDKYLKRAGLDYWDLVEVVVHDSFDELLDTVDHNRFFFATTKGGHRHSDFSYFDECYLVFGKETKGIDEALLKRFEDRKHHRIGQSCMKRFASWIIQACDKFRCEHGDVFEINE